MALSVIELRFGRLVRGNWVRLSLGLDFLGFNKACQRVLMINPDNPLSGYSARVLLSVRR